MAEITHLHLRRAARDLAMVYRDLAEQMIAAAVALDRAERPLVDNYPAVNPITLAGAVQRAAILHHLLDRLNEKGLDK
jgi:hypothetical protein